MDAALLPDDERDGVRCINLLFGRRIEGIVEISLLFTPVVVVRLRRTTGTGAGAEGGGWRIGDGYGRLSHGIDVVIVGVLC